jgi:hypothetical protein
MALWVQPSISGPKKISKPGQIVNLKVKIVIFRQNTHLNTLRGRPEARAAARAAGTLGPPLQPSVGFEVGRGLDSRRVRDSEEELWLTRVCFQGLI